MNKYRPEGWDAIGIAKPIKAKEPVGTWVSQLDVDLVEAGFDAALEALEPLIRKIAPSSSLVDILYSKEKKRASRTK